jgi:hypothetical protein
MQLILLYHLVLVGSRRQMCFVSIKSSVYTHDSEAVKEDVQIVGTQKIEGDNFGSGGSQANIRPVVDI